jgi:hypothetical protein
MPFDYMFSADLFVEDMFRQLDALAEHFGVHRPGPKSVVTGASDAHTIICRLSRDLSAAPTRLEIIQGTGSLEHWNGHHIQEAWNRQATRPTKFHNTVFIGDVEAIRERLDRGSVPWIMDATLDFTRLWVGISPDDRLRYDPQWDGGLRIEILPFESFPIDMSYSNGAASYGRPGALVRVVERSFVVEQLDPILRSLSSSLGWEPAQPVDVIGNGAYLRAELACAAERSARLVLLEPRRSDGHVGAFWSRWGDGPYSITIAADGIEAKADEFRHHGLPFDQLEEEGMRGGLRLRVGADIVGGSVFEFVDAANLA